MGTGPSFPRGQGFNLPQAGEAGHQETRKRTQRRDCTLSPGSALESISENTSWNLEATPRPEPEVIWARRKRLLELVLPRALWLEGEMEHGMDNNPLAVRAKLRRGKMSQSLPDPHLGSKTGVLVCGHTKHATGRDLNENLDLLGQNTPTTGRTPEILHETSLTKGRRIREESALIKTAPSLGLP